jgi:primosomal protein N' (replication factor Y)
MPERRYAEVIVGVTAKKLDKVFHYGVPEQLKATLTEGMRVIVPFGARTVEGYVLGFTDIAGVPDCDIKDIIGTTDKEALLQHDLLALAGWIAERYMCSKVEAINAMMPKGARVTGHRYVFPAEEYNAGKNEDLSSLKELEYQAFQCIVNRVKITEKEIYRQFGERKGRSALKTLNGLGLIKIQGEIKAGLKPQVLHKVELAIDENQLQEIITGLQKSAPKQAQALKTARANGPAGIQDLVNKAGVSIYTVRELIKKGWLEVKATEVRRDPYCSKEFERTQALKLNNQQLKALKKINSAIDSGKHKTFLLHGVTGSGKTEIYLQAIDHCLKKGKQAIVLVPEISLTPMMIERFKGRFGDMVAVFHSRLSEGERFDEWRMIKSGQVKVVVGARSAVFAPFGNLGLIIIDEEHETTYKQEDTPKYHARDVAVVRAKLCRSVVILGSATPSLESYARAKAGNYDLLTLNDRVCERPMPVVEVIDLREEIQAGHSSIFSRSLINKVQEALKKKEQVILFLNRRGYSTFVVCRECGLVMKCPKCSISLTLHARENELRCHYCNFSRQAPVNCPKCSSKSIRHFGIGTQRVEAEAQKWFPDANIARMDMDTTTRKGSHEKILNTFKLGEADILIGTQMIAKGHDFPGVTLVGVITADTALNLPDFRAAERTFQLMTQVAGRAGRGGTPGEVIVQTYNPEHFSILSAQTHDYRQFYAQEMNTREVLGYPPYCSLVRIVVLGMDENNVIRGAEILAENLRQAVAVQNLGVEQPLLGPAPAPVNKLKNRYRWQICIRGTPGRLIRNVISAALEKAEKDRYLANLGISIDVDPVGMM